MLCFPYAFSNWLDIHLMFVCISLLDIDHHGLGVMRVQKQPTAIAAQVVPVTIIWGVIKNL